MHSEKEIDVGDMPRLDRRSSRTGARPIVAWMDPSYESGEALAWAAGISSKVGFPLTATTIWNPSLGELRPSAHDAARRHQLAELTRWCSTASEMGVVPFVSVIEGDGVTALVEFATLCDAAIIVKSLPWQRHTHFGAGDEMARRLLRSAAQPVALVPVAGARRQVRRVMIALDGADRQDWERSRSWAVELALSLDASVHLACFLPYHPEWVPANDPRSEWSVTEDAVRECWEPPLRREGLPVDVTQVEGADSVAAWTAAAHERHVDLILTLSEGRATSGTITHKKAGRIARLGEQSGTAVIAVPA